MKRNLVYVVLVLAIGASACAGCGPKTKPVLVKTDTAVYESVRAIHETARTLGDANVITVAQELRIQEALLPVSRIGEKITSVIVAWKSGPTPPELQQLIKELGALVTEVGNALPDGPGKSALLEKITLAQQAVLVVIVIMSGDTS